MKRIISYILIMSVVFSLLPQTAFANRQSHVTNLALSNASAKGTANYNLGFTWSPVTISNETEPGATNGDQLHNPTSYALKMVNHTKSETQETVAQSITGSISTVSMDFDGAGKLLHGCIYGFKIYPEHLHNWNAVGGGTITRLAAYVAGMAEEILFMTDIIVDGTGAGNSITVTWDNPTYRGQNMFNKYRIYYERGGNQVSENFETNYRDVQVINTTRVTDNTRPGINRIQYTITDAANITPGETYAVRIEPLLDDDSELRKINQGNPNFKIISLDGTSHKVTFKPRDNKEYRTDTVGVTIPLSIYEDTDKLKLVWPVLTSTTQVISQIKIFSNANAEDTGWQTIGTLYGANAGAITNYRVAVPTIETFYKIEVTYTSGVVIESEIASYDPTKVNIHPNKPEIFVDHTTTSPVNLLIEFSAFERHPFTIYEQALKDPYTGLMIDRDVYYDVYITDDLSNFQDENIGIRGEVPKTHDAVLGSTLLLDTVTNRYKLTEGSYSHFNQQTNVYVTRPIEENKLYFIRVVAKKKPSIIVMGKEWLMGVPETVSHYVPAFGDMSKPQTISKPPLKIKVNDEGIREITETSIAIEWAERWYEVYDEVGGRGWIPLIRNTTDNSLTVDYIVDSTQRIVLPPRSEDGETEEQYIARAKVALENIVQGTQFETWEGRLMDVTVGGKAEIYVTPYRPIDETPTGYNEYLEELLESGVPFTKIQGTPNGDFYEYTIEGLTANTPYAILFRLTRTTDKGEVQAYPTYLTATTLPIPVLPENQPTVPKLILVSNTDTEATVKWDYTPGFKYELSVSEKLLSDPSGGYLIDPDDLVIAEVKDENGVPYKYYTIKGLFPETIYYVYIRAIAVGAQGELSSAWSNPINFKTYPLERPDYPDGFGLASNTSMLKVNLEQGTDIKPREPDSITLEWIRDVNDETPSVSLTGEGFEALSAADIIDTKLVRFLGLIANRQYYTRIKTIVVLTKADGIGTATKTFYYQIEFSKDAAFQDIVTAIVPDISGIVVGQNVLRADSDWSPVLIFRSGTSNDEYDGLVDPDLIPLPEEDFEIIYDEKTSTLDYIFRSGGTDKEGNNNNRVDQRLISRLIENRVYTYVIDISKYHEKEVKIRRVTIPYTVIKAFEEHKVEMKVLAGNLVYTVPYGFINTNQVMNMAGYGDNAKVILTFAENSTIRLSTGESYVSIPQKISARVTTPMQEMNLVYFAKPAVLQMKLTSRYEQLDKNVSSYMYKENLWKPVQSTYEQATGTQKLSTGALGVYGVIGKATPANVGIYYDDALASVHSMIPIKNLGTYDRQRAIPANELNNIILAIAKDKGEIDVKAVISQEDAQSLQRAGMYVTGNTVAKEQAISAFARLYEVKSKMAVTPATKTSKPDMNSVSATYKNNVLKAEAIGMLDHLENVSPKSAFTYGDAMTMAEIVLLDKQ